MCKESFAEISHLSVSFLPSKGQEYLEIRDRPFHKMYLQKMQTSLTPTHLQLINTNVFYQINPDLGSTYWTKSGTKILIGWVYIFLNIQHLNPVFEEGKTYPNMMILESKIWRISSSSVHKKHCILVLSQFPVIRIGRSSQSLTTYVGKREKKCKFTVCTFHVNKM